MNIMQTDKYVLPEGDYGRWTEASIDCLRLLVEDKWTMAQIAEKLGFTRNAIIGKAFRLGLSAKRTPMAPKAKPLPESITELARIDPMIRRSMPIEVKKACAPLPEEAGPPLSGTEVRLLDLRNSHCRFPRWGHNTRPVLAEMIFCGAKAVPGKAYCAECRKLTVTISTSTRR